MENSAEENSAEENSAVENFAEENSAMENSAVENSAVENSAEENSAVENSAMENSAVENSAEENPAVKNSAEKHSAEENSAVDNSAEENSVVENSAEKHSAEEISVEEDSDEELILEEVDEDMERLILNVSLADILMSGGAVTEDSYWDALVMAKLIDPSNFTPSKPIITSLFLKKYLKCTKSEADPSTYMISWGQRAHAETTKMFILEKVAQTLGKPPHYWTEQYEEARRYDREASYKLNK